LPKKSLFRTFFFVYKYGNLTLIFKKILGYIFVFLVEFQINIFWGKILPIFQLQNKEKNPWLELERKRRRKSFSKK